MSASPKDITPITSMQLVRPTDPGNEADVVSRYPAPDTDNTKFLTTLSLGFLTPLLQHI